MSEVTDAASPVLAVLRRDVRIAIEVEPGLPLIDGDATQLCQVFSNLLTNAFEAMNGAGHVTLRALRAKRVSVASPYEPWLNEKLRVYLEAAGFAVDLRRAPNYADGLAAHRAEHAPDAVVAMAPSSHRGRRLVAGLGVTLTPDELERAIIAGTIWDGMTLAAWAIARHTL